MSTPPPLPRENVEDVPIAETVEVAAEFYPATAPRPGILTALGVCSIVFSVLQVGYAVMIAIVMFGIYILSMVASPSYYTAAQANRGVPQFLAPSPSGVDMPQRLAIARPIAAAAHLSPARAQVLETLIAEYGADIAPTLSGRNPATPDQVRKFITGTSRGEDGADLIDVSTGRFTITDSLATFEPVGTTQVMTLDFAHAAIQPGTPGFDAGLGAAATQPAVAPVTPVLATTAPATPATKLMPAVHRAVIPMVFISATLSALLAILLMIAGIFALRGRRAARATHLAWAWLKLPVAITGAIGTVGMARYMADAEGIQAAQTSGAPFVSDPAGVVMAYTYGILQGLLSLAYIVAVMLVMRARSVRSWLEARQGPL